MRYARHEPRSAWLAAEPRAEPSEPPSANDSMGTHSCTSVALRRTRARLALRSSPSHTSKPSTPRCRTPPDLSASQRSHGPSALAHGAAEPEREPWPAVQRSRSSPRAHALPLRDRSLEPSRVTRRAPRATLVRTSRLALSPQNSTARARSTVPTSPTPTCLALALCSRLTHAGSRRARATAHHGAPRLRKAPARLLRGSCAAPAHTAQTTHAEPADLLHRSPPRSRLPATSADAQPAPARAPRPSAARAQLLAIHQAFQK
jgi:hypothetical protein